jgi:predicted amidophosphoribosyltransferase
MTSACNEKTVLPRYITYASCYVYSPQGTSAVCERSRLLCALLKSGDRYFIDKYVDRIQQQVAADDQLAGFFSAPDILMPVPSCMPGGGVNAPARLADVMVRRGLGSASWRGLKRAHAVHKSATAKSRPTVAMHFESFRVEALDDPSPESIMLIDDVVTKGRTLLAAAARVHIAFPKARIRAFAVLRTMGLVPEVPRIFEPWRGCIRWLHGDAQRDFGIESA